jgi:hypothetical protein
MRNRNKCQTVLRANTKSPWMRTRRARLLGVVVLAVTANACGASNPAPKVRGTPDLAAALPAPNPSPFGLSYGHGNAAMAEQKRGADAIETRSKLSAVAVARSNSKPASAERARPSAQPPLDAKLTPSTTTEPVAASGTGVVALQHPATLQSSLDTDSQRYAQRQNASRNLERYRGGDVVVIGATTLVLVLLIVLLIVLIL